MLTFSQQMSIVFDRIFGPNTYFNLGGKFYAGIGSRETPPNVQALMHSVGFGLAMQGWTLRTGGAEGADTAFLNGALDAHRVDAAPAPHVWMPWPNFVQYPISASYYPDDAYIDIAGSFHPAWDRCGQGARKLHGRNVGQIFGSYSSRTDECDTYFDWPSVSRFVICWTKDGGATGGTGMAISLAQNAGIPVFNLNNPATRERLEAFAS